MQDFKIGITTRTLGITIFIMFLLSISTYCWYSRYKQATELYCQANYNNNVIEYEQCKKKDLVILLQQER